MRGNLQDADSVVPTMSHIDKVLHTERAMRGGGKIAYQAPLARLPCGVMFEYAGGAYLVYQDGYRQWTLGGYGSKVDIDRSIAIIVLTLLSIVRAFERWSYRIFLA